MIPFALNLVTALGCGVIAGVFFAFSTFVMCALARLPAAQGIAAMQSINVLAMTPPFMIAMFGSRPVPACRWPAGRSAHWATRGRCLLAGGACTSSGRSA